MKEQDSLSINAKLLCYKPIWLTCLGKVGVISIGAVSLTACTYDLCVCAFSLRSMQSSLFMLCHETHATFVNLVTGVWFELIIILQVSLIAIIVSILIYASVPCLLYVIGIKRICLLPICLSQPNAYLLRTNLPVFACFG